MSMIALPPGMTPEEYFATPAGRRAQAANERFAQGSLAKPSSGAARPKQDPYASSTKSQGVNDIAREIEAALGEMAPELDPSERRLMASELAREYSQERQAAARELTRGPAAESPDPSREWKWDGNKYEYTDTPEYQARSESRKAQRMETEEQQARRVQRVRQQQMRNNVAIAQKSERDRPGSAGAFGQMAKKLGRPATPGMAQPKQPQSQGTPYGGMAKPSQPLGQGTPLGQGGGFQPPDPQQLYWESVQAGMSPKEAQRRVTEMVDYASGRLRTGPVAPSWTAKYPST